MKLALIFATNVAPLVVVAILFVLFWMATKAVLRNHRRGDRGYQRQQALWSHWGSI